MFLLVFLLMLLALFLLPSLSSLFLPSLFLLLEIRRANSVVILFFILFFSAKSVFQLLFVVLLLISPVSSDFCFIQNCSWLCQINQVIVEQYSMIHTTDFRRCQSESTMNIGAYSLEYYCFLSRGLRDRFGTLFQ